MIKHVILLPVTNNILTCEIYCSCTFFYKIIMGVHSSIKASMYYQKLKFMFLTCLVCYTSAFDILLAEILTNIQKKRIS